MDLKVLPPLDPNVCKECGREHEPEEPHDIQRLQYQYSFYEKHGRWPTWKDAMAHCPKEMQEGWELILKAMGEWKEEEGTVN